MWSKSKMTVTCVGSEGYKRPVVSTRRFFELHPAKRVLSQVAYGPEQEISTKLSCELKHEGGYAIVLFNA